MSNQNGSIPGWLTEWWNHIGDRWSVNMFMQGFLTICALILAKAIWCSGNIHVNYRILNVVQVAVITLFGAVVAFAPYLAQISACWKTNTWRFLFNALFTHPIVLVIERVIATYNVERYEMMVFKSFPFALLMIQYASVAASIFFGIIDPAESQCSTHASLNFSFYVNPAYAICTLFVVQVASAVVLTVLYSKNSTWALISRGTKLGVRYQLKENMDLCWYGFGSSVGTTITCMCTFLAYYPSTAHYFDRFPFEVELAILFAQFFLMFISHPTVRGRCLNTFPFTLLPNCLVKRRRNNLYRVTFDDSKIHQEMHFKALNEQWEQNKIESDKRKVAEEKISATPAPKKVTEETDSSVFNESEVQGVMPMYQLRSPSPPPVIIQQPKITFVQPRKPREVRQRQLDGILSRY